MKPLASPVAEYRLMGLEQIASGCALGVAGVMTDGALVAMLGLVLVAVYCAAFMYLLGYRRWARRAVRDPAPATTVAREPLRTTHRRVGVPAAVLFLSCVEIAALTRTPSLVAGILVGNRTATLGISRVFRRWEQAHAAHAAARAELALKPPGPPRTRIP